MGGAFFHPEGLQRHGQAPTLRGQPLDQKKLRLDEEAWLASMRNCNDRACVQGKYEERLAEMRGQSLRLWGLWFASRITCRDCSLGSKVKGLCRRAGGTH